MGFGASKIDYKERNFTEQPLDDQEINILLQALPEENIIDSIESEGREKILRSMSDQKVFNIRGDNIFDYYFTNNKEDIKGCMSNQFTRDGTPCPDEKFNRMITKIPNLVQGPLGEKETEWDTERQSLKSQYNTLNTKHDTLQQKRQQNLEALALDGFLANPEMYNKMLMEKMSEKAVDIFTKDGDIDINVKEFVEHSSIKSTLNRSYTEKKTVIPGFVEGFKKQASNLLNGFNKETADGVKSQMPPLGFLMTLIQMKIAVQYSGSDKTKIAPNRTLYNYFSEFFDELGIGTNNIEYTLKFITFNTFKKFMEYDLKNDVKGIKLYLQDFLKLIKEFGGEEYLNSLSNFEIDTGLKGSYNDLSSEKTELQLQYETLNDSNTELKKQYDTLNTQKGDLETKFNESNKERKDLKNKYSQLEKSKRESMDTLVNQKNELQTQYDTLNDSKTELQSQYDNLEGQKGDLESEIQKNLLSSVIRVTDGDNTKTVSEQQCKAYAKSLGTTMGKGNDTSGCYLAPHKGGGYGVYYTKKTGRGKCYYNNKNDYRVCIQNNLNRNNTYSKKGCRGDVGGEYDCRVDGTWDQITLKGWDRNKYGQTLDAAKHFCNTHKDCVAVASSSANWNWPVHTTSKFKPCNKYREVGSGSPDLSITKEECKAHAKSIGRPFYHDSNHAHYALGCSRWLSGNDIYWSENPDASDKKCGHGGHHCIKKEICDPKMNYHEKRKCKKPIDGVWTKAVGKSCEWECPGRSGVEKHTVPKFHIGKAYACSARDYAYDKNKKAHSEGDRKLTYALSGGAKGHFACRRQDNVHFSYKSYSQSDDRMTHKSSCSDWDNPAMFYKEVVAETVDIDVGSSTGKTKVVDLPHKNMTVSNKPINSKHNDTFEVAVSGTKLTVTRTDSNNGWGQNLVLRGTKEVSANAEEIMKPAQGGTSADGKATHVSNEKEPGEYTHKTGKFLMSSVYGTSSWSTPSLDGKYGWLARSDRRTSPGWMRMETVSGDIEMIKGVVTKGYNSGHHTTKFKVYVSRNGDSWKQMKDSSGNYEFSGGVAQKTNYFKDGPVEAKYIKFYPTAGGTWRSLNAGYVKDKSGAIKCSGGSGLLKNVVKADEPWFRFTFNEAKTRSPQLGGKYSEGTSASTKQCPPSGHVLVAQRGAITSGPNNIPVGNLKLSKDGKIFGLKGEMAKQSIPGCGSDATIPGWRSSATGGSFGWGACVKAKSTTTGDAFNNSDGGYRYMFRHWSGSDNNGYNKINNTTSYKTNTQSSNANNGSTYSVPSTKFKVQDYTDVNIIRQPCNRGADYKNPTYDSEFYGETDASTHSGGSSTTYCAGGFNGKTGSVWKCINVNKDAVEGWSGNGTKKKWGTSAAPGTIANYVRDQLKSKFGSTDRNDLSFFKWGLKTIHPDCDAGETSRSWDANWGCGGKHGKGHMKEGHGHGYLRYHGARWTAPSNNKMKFNLGSTQVVKGIYYRRAWNGKNRLPRYWKMKVGNTVVKNANGGDVWALPETDNLQYILFDPNKNYSGSSVTFYDIHNGSSGYLSFKASFFIKDTSKYSVWKNTSASCKTSVHEPVDCKEGTAAGLEANWRSWTNRSVGWTYDSECSKDSNDNWSRKKKKVSGQQKQRYYKTIAAQHGGKNNCSVKLYDTQYRNQPTGKDKCSWSYRSGVNEACYWIGSASYWGAREEVNWASASSSAGQCKRLTNSKGRPYCHFIHTDTGGGSYALETRNTCSATRCHRPGSGKCNTHGGWGGWTVG